MSRQSTLSDIIHINIVLGMSCIEKRVGWAEASVRQEWNSFALTSHYLYNQKSPLIEKMHQDGKATQILVKRSVVYLLIKHFNSTSWKETLCLPEAILPYFKKTEIYILSLNFTLYATTLWHLGWEAPNWSYLQHSNIFTIFILAQPLVQAVHLCYCHEQAMQGEKHCWSVKLDSTLNLSWYLSHGKYHV